MKFGDGNDTARPFANESAVDRVEDLAEEKKDLSPRCAPQPCRAFRHSPPVVIVSEVQPKSRESSSKDQLSNISFAQAKAPPKKPRKILPRRPSDMLRAERLQEEQDKSADLHIESASLQDPDLAALDRAWTMVLFICNLYNYFTFFFFVGIQLSPQGVWLIAEILSELILLADAMAMLFISLKKPWLLRQMPLLSLLEHGEKEMSRTRLILRLVSSYPQHTINVLCRVSAEHLESLPLALLRGLKLLRYPDTADYINKKLRQVKGTYAVYVRGLEKVFSIVFLFHIMCCLWLLVIRLQSPSPWKYKFGFDKANVLEYYSIALLFAVSNRGGTAPGDSYPVSPMEKLTFCALVFCASTTVAALFGSLASGIYITNARTIQNNRKLDQIKIYSGTRNLPEELRSKIRNYFSMVHLEYSKYEEQYALLHELPRFLQTELVLHINVDFIQKVKFFQLSETPFIMSMVNHLKPIICLAGDYIVRRGELADSMYFIKSGLTRVLCADDEKITLAYMGEGNYFGEIGVLLTGKRSVSVVAHTDCVLYYIEKDALKEILEQFGYHKVFLESVGRQRMQTTYLKDLQHDESVSAGGNMTCASVLNERSKDSPVNKLSEEKEERRFSIEPNSKLHATGSLLLSMAIAWNLAYTVFALCFEDVMKTETNVVLILIDVVFYVVCILDIPFQYSIAAPTGSTFYTSRACREGFRLSIWSVLDVISVVPFDYILWAIGYPTAWLRCVQMLKFHRLLDIRGVIRAQFKMFHLFNMVLLSALFFMSSHIFACLLYRISLYEYNRGGRFDGRSFITSIKQSYTLFPEMMDDTIGHRYVHCIYTGICMMGLASFGDVVSCTPLEDLYSSVVALYSKLFMAFFYAEVSSYVSSFYSSYVEHVSKTYLILSWLKLNNLPDSIAARVVSYRNILWRKFKGIEESSLIASMPATLGYKIKYHILEKFVQNADVIPKDEPGAIVAIVKNLSIRVYPKGEFVIMEGEIATEMFFLVEGIVDIYNSRGVKLNRLTEGKCFGEMALIKGDGQIRMASAYCASDVSVAILGRDKFNTICQAYPLFKEKIFEIVREREAQNVIKASNTTVLPLRSPLTNLLNESRVESPSPSPVQSPVRREKTTLQIAAPGETRMLTRLSTIIESRVAGEMEVPAALAEETGINKRKIIVTSVKFVLCLYNFIFIPLQMAFRIAYTPLLYTVEAIILVVHLGDIVYLVMKYRGYSSKVFAESDNEEDSDGQKRINEEVAIKKRSLLLKSLIWESFTLPPWSMILQNVYYPTYVVACVKMIRLLKVWPITKFLGMLKTNWLNAVRIAEVIFYYFIFAHIMSCLMILMMYIPPTFNESWVRRLPFPQVDIYGHREGNDMTGVSNSDIYMAALYVTYITLSHVTIGDVSAVTINERILTTIYVAFALHLYVILFASITSMVSDLARSLQATLQQKYESILANIRCGQLPAELFSKIKDYFDYLWLESKGIDQDYLDGLPDGIRNDIQLMLYKKSLEKAFLFKGANNTFDRRVAMSLFKVATIKKCMKGDLVLKAGSNCSKTIFVLEGELALIGVPNSRVGIIQPGLFYSGILAGKPRQPRPANLVATMASTIGVIREDDMQLMMNAFPVMKNRMFFVNQTLDSRCQDTLDEYIHTFEVLKPALDVLEDDYVLKDREGYSLVLEEALKPVDPFTVNLNKAVDATHALVLENQGETGSTSLVPPVITRLNRSKARVQADEEEEHSYFLDQNMSFYFAIYLIHLANIVYTACVVPLQVGFDYAEGPVMLGIEGLCCAESVVHIILRLRTVVLIRGQTFSYSFADIFKTYRENGFYYDIFGVLPLNLIFLAAGVDKPLYVIVPLKLIRVLTLGNAANIISYLQLRNYNLSSMIHLTTILTCFFLLWHWIASFWYFVNIEWEDRNDLTWERFNELTHETLGTKYSFAMYYTLKMAAGAGSADSFAATNTERIASCFIVHVGDVLFAVIFGLIAAYASSLASDTEEYLMQKKKVEEFADSFGITKEHKERIEEYYTYMSSLNYHPIMYKKLKEQLPAALAKEIVYETNKQILLPMFESFSSLNFLKKLSYSIETVHYAPGDYIIQRGEMGAEMHFIIEGRVAYIAADKHTVLKRVEKGQYFGEAALFIKKQREYYVRAETYACVCVLKKNVFEKLIARFTRLRGKVRRMAKEYERRMGKKVQHESDSEEEARLDIISTLQGLRRHQSASDVRERFESYTKKKVTRAKRKAQSRLNVIPVGSVAPMQKKATFTTRKTRKMNDDHEEEEENPYEPLSAEHPLDSVENNLLANSLLVEDQKSETGNKYLTVRRAQSGILKPQRRLSKLTLGKELAISPNTGVKFEWTVSRNGAGDDIKL